MELIATIKAEIERLMNDCTLDEDYKAAYKFSLYRLMRFLDTLQEPDGLHFLPMVRLVEMIRTDEWNDRGKRYAEKLVSALENEGYPTDARLVRNHIKYMDGEDVPMATMDNQEPEIDFEQELYNRFGMVKDFTLGMRIAQCFYNLGKGDRDTIFHKGMMYYRKQMMGDAVEGEVVKDISNKLAVTAKINLDGFKFGDKVRVIVCKMEDGEK